MNQHNDPATPAEPQPNPLYHEAQESPRLLLPAWSSTTVASRAVRAAPEEREGGGKRSFWNGCLIGGIAAIVVLSLLGSSLFSLFWFWNQRSERIAGVNAAIAAHAGLGESGRLPLAGEDAGAGADPRFVPQAVADADPVDRIVFVNDNRQVETMKPDGGERRELTADAKSYLFPAWAPDGRAIAVIGGAVNGGGVYRLTDEETPRSEEIYFSQRDTPIYLYWAPDAQKIGFLANDINTGLSLNVVDALGEESSRQIAGGSPLYWNWTADSRRLLLHQSRENEDSQLYMIDEFGRPQSPRVPAPGPFQAPGLSVSGRYWAYSQFQAGGTSWLVLDDLNRGAAQRQRHAGAIAFNWSPTRDEVAFISGRGDDEFSAWGPLRLMDAETGDVRLLSPDTVLAFFWSPDGSKIATISVPQQQELGDTIEVRAQKGRRLSRAFVNHARPQRTQFGPHTFQVNVIDVRSGEGLQLVDTALSPLFLTQFLPYFDQYAFSHQIWSPDSTRLVLPLGAGRGSEITLVDTRNGRTTPLAEGVVGFWSRQ